MSQTSTAPAQYFVILADGLGKWRKGDVVAGTVMLETGCDIDRLLSLKAMRNATEAENSKGHIEIVSPERHASYEQQLADKDKEIARLTARVCALEEQIAAGAHIAQSAQNAPMNESALIEEKDRAIRSLEARSTALAQELAATRANSSAVHAELTALRAEVGVARQQSADAAADAKPATPAPETPADRVVRAERENGKRIPKAERVKPPEVAQVPGGRSVIKRMA